MRHIGPIRLLTVAFAAVLATAAIAETRPLQEAGDQEKHKDNDKDRDQDPDRGERSTVDVITPLLQKRLAGKGSLDDVVVDVRWPVDGAYTSTRIYGDGAGIWKREFQIRLSKTEVRRLVQLLVKERFGSLPLTSGGDEGKSEKALKGRVIVLVGPVSRRASQFDAGDQSPELEEIAREVVETSAKAAASGQVAITSLSDGLAKVESGALSPETLHLEVRRRVATIGSEGWRLWGDGRRLYDVVTEKTGRPSSARALVLSSKDFSSLAKSIADADPGNLPQNLYAAQYTDVLIQLLNKSRHIQGRQFSGMTATTHGEKQAAFDRLVETLAALHARAQKQGRVVSLPDQRDAEIENREHERGEEQNEERDREQRERSEPKPKPESKPSAAATPASPGRS